MLSKYPVVANVPSTDLDRSRKFYSDVLGLESEGGIEGESLHYVCGNGTMLEVYRTRAAVGAGHTEAGFMVDDLDTVVSGLRDAGVTFEEYDLGDGMATVDGVLDTGDGRAAWFQDPDGNVIGLFEERATG